MPSAPVEPPVPPLMAERELARSRRCVPAIARFTALQQEVEPMYQRASRIQMLNAAVELEDSARAAPFNLSDSVEVAVREWFLADEALARQYVATPTEAIAQQRSDA